MIPTTVPPVKSIEAKKLATPGNSFPPYTPLAGYTPVGHLRYLVPKGVLEDYPPDRQEKLFGSVLSERFGPAHSIDPGSAYAQALGLP